jgi:hypothetical protein
MAEEACTEPTTARVRTAALTLSIDMRIPLFSNLGGPLLGFTEKAYPP